MSSRPAWGLLAWGLPAWGSSPVSRTGESPAVEIVDAAPLDDGLDHDVGRAGLDRGARARAEEWPRPQRRAYAGKHRARRCRTEKPPLRRASFALPRSEKLLVVYPLLREACN